MKKIIPILMLLWTCASPQIQIEKPKDYGNVIVETQREIEKVKDDKTVKSSPELQNKVGSLQNQIYKLSIALKESEEYGKDSFSKYQAMLDTVNKANAMITKKDLELKEKDEKIKELSERFISPKMEKTFWFTIGIVAFFLILGIVFLFLLRSGKLGLSVATRGAA